VGVGEFVASDGWKIRKVDLLQRYPRQTEFNSFLTFPRGWLFLLQLLCYYTFLLVYLADYPVRLVPYCLF